MTYSTMSERAGQSDPAGFHDGTNLYEYVRSNPVNATDPTGLWARTDDWRKENGEYAGKVRAERGDTFERLAMMITGNPEDAAVYQGLGKPMTPSPGDVIDVSPLLKRLEDRVRTGIAQATSAGLAAGFPRTDY